MELNTAERYRSILPLYGSFLAAAIYMSGIGRYNTLLVTAGLYLLESILLYRRTSLNLIKPVFGPAVAVAAIIDIMLEGTFPLRLAGAFGAFAVAELVAKKHLMAVVEGLTGLRLFGQCPSCNYANRDLVDECKNCGFSATSGSAARQQEFTPVTVSGGECAGTKLRVPKRCLDLLNLQEDERCIANVRIFPERGVYEDGGVVLVKHLVITNARLIFIDYHFFNSGWMFRRDIPLGGVEASILVRRHHQKKDVPILVLKTPQATYEIFYSPRMSARKKVEAIQSCINSLASRASVAVSDASDRTE